MGRERKKRYAGQKKRRHSPLSVQLTEDGLENNKRRRAKFVARNLRKDKEDVCSFRIFILFFFNKKIVTKIYIQCT